MPTECCVPQCTNRGGHAFPWSQKDRVKSWMVAIQRDFWKPTIHSVVCSSHFDSSDYVCETSSGTKLLQKKLKPTAVPHIFNWTPAESSATLKRRKRHIQRELEQNTQGISDVIMMDENTEVGCQETVSSAPTEETDFKAKYPNTRVIVDSTECPIFKPKQPLAQQATYSTYKNRNTVKVLVGCTPGGLVSYVSSAYGGFTSDRQICEISKLTMMCDPGDSIMADKGFNVEDIFIPFNIHINIPIFFKAKNRLSSRSVLKDRKIASKRVHVERIIGLAKTYKILCNPLNNTEFASWQQK